MAARQAESQRWHRYIRGDLRRELLRLECEELEDLLEDYHPRQAPEEWDMTGSAQHGFAAKTLSDNGGTQVFLAGRNFFIDPSIATITNKQEFHKYLIFLSFARIEDSLQKYATALGSISNATLFVPWILWEQFYALEPLTLRKWTVCPSDAYWLPQAASKDDQTDSRTSTDTAVDSRRVLVGFDRWLDLAVENELPDRVPGFFEDVRLHLSFAFGAKPSLQAAFRCNGRTLIISRSEGIGAAQVAAYPESDSVVMGKLKGLMRRLRRRTVHQNDLQRYLAERLTEIQIWRQGGLPCDESRTMPLHRLVRPTWGQLPPKWIVPRGPEYGPQIAIARPKSEPLLVPKLLNTCSVADFHALRIRVPTSVQLDAKLASKSIVAITCGRPATLAHRRPELVGPLLKFPASGDGDDAKIVSLLEWQLARVADLARKMKAKAIKVLLSTTPLVGEDIVLILDRLENCDEKSTRDYESNVEQPDREWNIKIGPNDGYVTLNIHLTRGQLLTQSDVEDDAEWSLSYNSHFDVVRSLCRFYRKNCDSAMDIRYALILSHNNLGVLWNNESQKNGPWTNVEQTARYLKTFAKCRKALAVEAFAMRPGDEPRWRELSYFVKTQDSVCLLKKCWGDAQHWPEHEPYFSSNTWYLDLEQVDKFVNEHDIMRLKIAENRTAPEPIDLLTWKHAWTNHPGFGVFLHQRLEDHEKASPYEFHRHSRFAVVLEDEQFNHLPDGLVVKPNQTSSATKKLWPMIPTIKRNVWGGRQIAARKHLDGDPKIGETWEISTHPAGPSRYRDAMGDERPLQQEVGMLPIMGKYLDCEQPLSIQIHPTTRSLSDTRGEHGDRAGTDLAKEESFYVIAPARRHEGDKERQHLVYGFNRETLDAYVAELRPWIVHHQDQEIHPDDIIDQLGEIIAGFFDDALRISEYTQNEEGEIIRNDDDLKSLRENLVERFALQSEREPLRKAIRLYSTGGLDGKEYLVMGAALIRALEVLTFQKGTEFGSALHKHYERRCGATGFGESPIFRMFNTMQFSSGQWVRVPAGTPHAVQGGGNLLVEMSNRSDHTYRILDFGREFTNKPRDLHFADAMGALDDQAFHYKNSEQRFVVNTSRERFGICHKDLESRLHEHGQNDKHEFETTKEITYYFNLGGAIRADTDNETLPIPPFSSMVATKGTNVRLQLTEAEDRVLEIRKRIEHKKILLGYRPRYRVGERGHWPGSHYVWFYEGGSPSVSWAEAPTLPKDWQKIVCDIRAKAGSSDSQDESPEPHVTAMSYPGHVRYEDDGSTTLHMGSNAPVDFTEHVDKLAGHADVVIGDAQASALGEGYHMLGRFVARARGMTLNLSAGVCCGFWDDRLRRPQSKSKKCDTETDRGRMNFYSMVGAIGRWLYVDPSARRQFYFANGEKTDVVSPDMKANLKRWTFRDQIATTITTRDGNKALRLSTWLSADAIALRAEKRILNIEDVSKEKSSTNKSANAVDEYLGLYATVADLIDHKRCFQALMMDEDGQLEDFTRSVATDIADVIGIVRNVLNHCHCNDNFTEMVVLTGSVAESFGWIESPKNASKYQDLLLKHIEKSIEPNIRVCRSQIAAPAAREGAGLAGFCWGGNAL